MTTAVYPATFDPIHYGHLDIIRRAAAIFDEVIVGVYDRPLKNLLFDVSERLALVREAVADIPRVRVTSYSGLTVDFAREAGAQVILRGLRVVSDFELEWRMALTNKQLAPELEVLCLMTNREYAFLSSSIVREVALLNGDVSGMVPMHIVRALARKAGHGHQTSPVSLND
ncbi:MAG: pantetheine-phosphate adenylyltransferase [Anaerolineae bacterium]